MMVMVMAMVKMMMTMIITRIITVLMITIMVILLQIMKNLSFPHYIGECTLFQIRLVINLPAPTVVYNCLHATRLVAALTATRAMGVVNQ